MKRTQLIVVRHGQTVWNCEKRLQGHCDSALTELGLFQTDRIAERLASLPCSAIYSSDLQRAYQTAKPIAENVGREVSIDQRLRERNYGIFEGLTRLEIKEKYPDEFFQFKIDPEFSVPKGESATGFYSRCVSCFEELASRHVQQRIIVITHQGVIDSLFRYILNIPLTAPRRFKSLEASINSVFVKRGKWFLETWGDVSHWREWKQIK